MTDVPQPGTSNVAPEPAPEIIMDANGAYWRRYPDDTLSMVPVSTDNDPLAAPVAVYRLVGWEGCDCGSMDHTSARCPNRVFR